MERIRRKLSTKKPAVMKEGGQVRISEGSEGNDKREEAVRVRRSQTVREPGRQRLYTVYYINYVFSFIF